MSDPATKALALKSALARLLRTAPEAIGPETPLPDLGNSLARGAFESALRHALGPGAPPLPRVRTYGELEAALLGEGPAATTMAAPVSARALGPGGGIGIDVERVADLPEAPDVWESPFYRATFGPGETAYCLAQVRPREHFTARWCAKEALFKCDPAPFAGGPASRVEVAQGPEGVPHFVGPQGRLPHRLSLSHTSDLAVAVVLAPTAPAPSPTPAIAAPVPSGRGRDVPTLALALLALAVALAGLALAASQALALKTKAAGASSQDEGRPRP